MSRNRLLRLSLILAVLGLNPAHAQGGAPLAGMIAAAGTPDAAQNGPQNAPQNAPQNVVRPEMLKLLDLAAIRDWMQARDYAQVRSRIEQAAALPDPSDYERYVLNRMRIALALASGDSAMAIRALEAVLESGRGAPAERAGFIEALASFHYNAKNYPQAIRWFAQYQKETGDGAKLRPYLIHAYYFNNDYGAARQALLDDLRADEQSGRQPSVDQLRLLANCGANADDGATYELALEKLVRFHPSDEYWNALLGLVGGPDGAPSNIELEVLRLGRAALAVMPPEKTLRMAQLALQAGFPAEAEQVLDATGAPDAEADAAAHRRLREQAARAAAADRKGWPGAMAAAARSPNGASLVSIGYAQVTLQRFDQGIGLIEKGVARGVARNPDLARLRLGYAYAMAGRREQARTTLAALDGSGYAGRLARYWLLWLDRPAAR